MTASRIWRQAFNFSIITMLFAKVDFHPFWNKIRRNYDDKKKMEISYILVILLYFVPDHDNTIISYPIFGVYS